MRRQVEFWVSGNPAPQPRPRMTRRGHAYNPPTADEWKKAVRTAWAETGAATFLEGISIRLSIYMERPKSHLGKRGLKPSAPVKHTSKPDADNLAKAIMDALENAGAFKNDSQAYAVNIWKQWATPGVFQAESPGCLITLIESDD